MLPFDVADLSLLAQNSVNQSRDLVVALIAIGLGINIIYSVQCKRERCFQLSSVRMVERNLGRRSATLMLYGLGSLCVLLGIYLIADSSLRKGASSSIGNGTVPPVPTAGLSSQLAVPTAGTLQ